MKSQPVVLITGCSSGIGYALAEAFQARGCVTYATARKPETLAPLAAQGIHTLTLDVTREALKLEGIDEKGLDDLDCGLLRTLIDIYHGGPAGVEAIAASMGEEAETLVDVVEPFLLQSGFLMRTRQGRRVTKAAYDHLGLAYEPPAEGESLF